MSPAPATASARHRRTVTRSPVPRAPRRVSGPAARPVAVPRPALPSGFGVWLRNLPDHRLLDRLIRGRAWIVLLGVLLAGIVALQVSMLRLNAGISRSVEQAQTLQRANQQMQVSVAALGSDSRMEALAQQQGFHTPSAGSPRYLTVAAGDPSRAARGMKPPQPHQTTIAPTPAATSTTLPATAGAQSTTTTASASTPATTTQSSTATGTSGGATGAGTATSGTAGTTGGGTAIAAPSPLTSGTAGNSTGGASGG